MSLRERLEPLSVPCPACGAGVDEWCHTIVSGYPLLKTTHDLRQRDVALAALERVKNERDIALVSLAALTPYPNSIRPTDADAKRDGESVGIQSPNSFGVHSCHAECPCQHGGRPIPDFTEPEGDAA